MRTGRQGDRINKRKNDERKITHVKRFAARSKQEESCNDFSKNIFVITSASKNLFPPRHSITKFFCRDKERIITCRISRWVAHDIKLPWFYWTESFRVVEDRKKAACERLPIESNSIQAAKVVTTKFFFFVLQIILGAPVRTRRLCASGLKRALNVKFILSNKK